MRWKPSKTERNSPKSLASIRWNIDAVLTGSLLCHFYRWIFYKIVVFKRQIPPLCPPWFWVPPEQASKKVLDISFVLMAPAVSLYHGEVSGSVLLNSGRCLADQGRGPPGIWEGWGAPKPGASAVGHSSLLKVLSAPCMGGSVSD